MMHQIRKGYEVDVAVTFTDDLGNPSNVDGIPVWNLSSPAFSIIVDEEGMSAVLQGTGAIIGETSVLTLTADADLGEGIVPIILQEDLQLISGTAAIATFAFGEQRQMTS